MRIRSIVFLSAAVTLVALASGAAQQAADEAVVIEMTARKYEFTPAEIHVPRGARVELRIRATDRAHGIRFDLRPEGADGSSPVGLRFEDGLENWRLEKDDLRVIRFTAERAGIYEFRCSVTCGLGHRRMRGRLVVEE